MNAPESLVAQIEAESREYKLSKSDAVRDRLTRAGAVQDHAPPTFAAIADLIGSVKALPPDLGVRKKHCLRVTGYGRKRPVARVRAAQRLGRLPHHERPVHRERDKGAFPSPPP